MLEIQTLPYDIIRFQHARQQNSRQKIKPYNTAVSYGDVSKYLIFWIILSFEDKQDFWYQRDSNNTCSPTPNTIVQYIIHDT
jgi:hypothetical protein